MKKFKQTAQKGFTLIELLVVIAILGILAAGVLVGIDPVDRINSANDSRVQNDVGTIGRASEAYATANSGTYPANIAALVTNGDLKITPSQPGGYSAYSFLVVTGGSCRNGMATCVYVWGQVKSKKYTNQATPLLAWRYESDNGKSCAVPNMTDQTTNCP